MSLPARGSARYGREWRETIRNGAPPLSFVVSKLAWGLLAPGNFLAFVLALGSVLLFTRWVRAGRIMVSAVALAFFAIAATPLADWAARPLEDRFPQASLPDHIDGIVVLGGAVNPLLTRLRGEPSVNEAAERLLAFVDLGRKHPEATMVFTGGWGALVDAGDREDVAARAVLKETGFDDARVVFENESRNTWENAAFSRRLAAPRPEQTWALVTSAGHMPRAIGVFRRNDWPVIPYPVDYRTTPESAEAWMRLETDRSLRILTDAVREWIGLVAYWAMGRIDSVFPAP